MLDLTFGEQVKIILRRKGMTIKELAERIEAQTGKKMSRQNLTQRLGRDNFQEQDMRQIAEILGCRFQLSIMEESVSAENNLKEEVNIGIDSINEVDDEMTVGEIIDQFVAPENIAVEQVVEEEPVVYEEEPVYEEEEVVYEEEPVVYEEEEVVYEEEPVVYEEEEVVYEEEPVQEETSVEDALKELESLEQEDRAYKLEKEEKAKKKGWKDRFGFYRKKEEEKEAQEEVVNAVEEQAAEEEPVVEEPVQEEEVVYEEEPVYEEEVVYEEEPVYEEPVGDVNPYTGREYETNSVRVHPKKIGYVQVYDREEHKWIDMTEWAFLGYQEQKKMLLGKDYDPPIYLD